MKGRRLVTIALALALVLAVGNVYASSHAKDKAKDQSWKFHRIVDAAFVKQHVKVPMAEDVMVIDSRPKKAKYDKGHIPLAVSIPDREFDKHISVLPTDKDALLIFYCGGQK